MQIFGVNGIDTDTVSPLSYELISTDPYANLTVLVPELIPKRLFNAFKLVTPVPPLVRVNTPDLISSALCV